jgi:hypothetical protein
MAQSREFCIWLVLSAQFLATATSSIAAGLPDWLFQLLRIVSFFNASPSYTSYEGCGSEYRFQTQLLIFVGVWPLVLAEPVAIYASHRRISLVGVAGFIFVAINALFSVVLQQCLKFLDCSASEDGGFIFTGGVATASVKLLPDGTILTKTIFMRYASVAARFAHSPAEISFGHGRCWSGEHLPLGLLAVASLIAVVIAFPLGAFIAWRRASRTAQFAVDKDSATQKLEEQIFHQGDYEFEFFWMRHVGWAVLVVVGILQEYSPVSPTSLRAAPYGH